MLPPIEEITVAAMLAASQSSLDAASAACASLNASAVASGSSALPDLQMLDAQGAQREGAGEVRVEINRPSRQLHGDAQIVGRKVPEGRQPAHVKVVGVEARRRLSQATVDFGLAQVRFDRAGDLRATWSCRSKMSSSMPSNVSAQRCAPDPAR